MLIHYDGTSLKKKIWGGTVAHQVESVPLRLSPYRSDPGSIPACGRLQKYIFHKVDAGREG